MVVAPRERFEAVADAYKRSRPGYPTELVRRLGPPGRTLEIGCGSGQLTVDLVRHGHDVVAVDLGERLLAHARRLCPQGEFVHGTFEEVDLGQQRFDLVASATAFHWVDHQLRPPVLAGDDERAGLLDRVRALPRAGGAASSARVDERLVSEGLPDADEAFRDALSRAVAGNPFFCSELVAAEFAG